MNLLKIHIIDDDVWLGELLKHHLSLNPDYLVSVFKSGKECLDNLYLKPDIICIDYGLPDITGDVLFHKIKQINNLIPIIILSGQEDISVAVKFLKEGAKDYIVKDEHSKDVLWNSIIKIRENICLKQEIEDLKEKLETKFSFEKNIIGQSEAIKKTFSLIEKAVKSSINISITGETGTGKEVVAKTIHYNSERKKKSFVAVNMAAIPKELIESELFGYEKGAFTGALNRKVGKFEEANGGTIFLDEIAELDLSVQSKILRVLQEREVVRVGGNERIKIDARLITATHKNLIEEVKKGTFREDLYYRIIGLPIHLPPLRDRGTDVLILAKHFLGEYAKENKTRLIQLSQSAINKLNKYQFPGNVRELKAVIDLAAVMCNDFVIEADDIIFNTLKEEVFNKNTDKTLKEYTSEIIFYYLKKYDNDVLKVAEKLDIGKSTIYNLLNQNKLEPNKN